MSVIDLVGGAATLGGRQVLHDVDLRVDHGEFVALMGPNGAGKSTLVRVLTELVPLSAGRLSLFDQADFHDWRRVGFVPQRVTITSGVPSSVWEVVASGRLARRRLFRPLSRHDRAVIEESIAAVGLEAKRHDPLTTLSGGQQQRALIARALAGEPELFFLDEPTAGVDQQNQVTLADTLCAIKARGATVVLVAHELGPLASLVDRTVVMRDGTKVYDGVPLADHDAHGPVFFGENHSHHHHDDEVPATTAVMSHPLERP